MRSHIVPLTRNNFLWYRHHVLPTRRDEDASIFLLLWRYTSVGVRSDGDTKNFYLYCAIPTSNIYVFSIRRLVRGVNVAWYVIGKANSKKKIVRGR